MQNLSWFIQLFSSRKMLTFNHVLILIQSIFDKDKNNYYYNIFLKKVPYELSKNNDHKQAFVLIINAILLLL